MIWFLIIIDPKLQLESTSMMASTLISWKKTLLSQDVMYMKQMDEHFNIKNVIYQQEFSQMPRFAVTNSSTLF